MVLSLPRVTVCVPVRNGSRTIRRTLDSILAQDYPNFEVIVSDNCSTDDTALIVQEYAKFGVKYYLNSKLEVSGESNWNHILSIAQGPLIALYHADDLYTPTMVRRQVEFLQTHPESGAVFTMSQRINEQDRPIRWGRTRLPGELAGRDLFAFSEFFNSVLKYNTFTPVPTMMTWREVIDTVGMFCWQNYGSASDIDLYLRIARQWGPIGLIDEALHLYRISTQQGSAIIAMNRTELQDFFLAVTPHLNDPNERQFVEPKSLAFYELQRANDQVLCAMNLLAQGKVAEARAQLSETHHWRYFVTALTRPRGFVQLVIGVCFWISTYLGLGTVLGQQVSRVYRRFLAYRREPVKG